MDKALSGTIVKSTGKWYIIRCENGKTIPARIQGKFRLNGLRLTNPVAVGDVVKFTIEDTEEETAIIREIQPRINYVVRQSPRRKHDLHLLAANVDRALLVVTINYPSLKQGFIDRFLLMTEPYNIPTHIIFNKSDLYTEEDMAVFNHLQKLYTKIGYDVHLVSSFSKKGLPELREVWNEGTSLVAGQSGVGKSTLVNTLAPSLNLKTDELSGFTGKGQHTTTFAEMHQLSDNGFIIDTPGIKTLSFNHLEPMDIAHNFREFFERAQACRFGANCLHRDEPGCAVKEAIADGEISELRYLNYLTLLDEVEEQNHWERISDY